MLNGFCRVDVDVTDACTRNQNLVLHSIACHFTDWMTPVHVLLFKDLQHWLPVGIMWTARNTWEYFIHCPSWVKKALKNVLTAFLHWINGVWFRHPLLVPRSKIEYSYTSTLPKGPCGLWKGEICLPKWCLFRIKKKIFFFNSAQHLSV
jgi:hypothetical protein